jgi:hypothetical protein
VQAGWVYPGLACARAGIRQALTRPDALQSELLPLPVETLLRLVRSLSPWGETLEQAERALWCWAEERRLEREADGSPDQAAYGPAASADC